MNSIEKFVGEILKVTVLTSYIMMSTIPAMAADGETSQCEDATRVDLNTVHRSYGRPEEGPDFYRMEVPFPGILSLDVVTPADSSVEATLAFFGESCRPDGTAEIRLRPIQRFVTAIALEIEAPGTYRFAVAAQDPELSLDEYKLTTRFVSEHDLSEPSVARLPQSDGFHVPEPDTVEEPEPQPEPDTVEEPEPQPEPDTVVGSDVAQDWLITPAPPLVQHSHAAEVCREYEEDDHGDTFLCATALTPGSTVTGELDNDWGDDEDLFSFDLSVQRTVQIRTGGDVDSLGVLYDRYGHRLAMDDDGGDGSGMRIVKTLGPGRYYLRIAGANAAEGLYTLAATVLGW